MNNTDTWNLMDNLTQFDKKHIVKQIILIGIDGKVRNIEFDVEVNNGMSSVRSK